MLACDSSIAPNDFASDKAILDSCAWTGGAISSPGYRLTHFLKSVWERPLRDVRHLHRSVAYCKGAMLLDSRIFR
jgi:hypothetical protein